MDGGSAHQQREKMLKELFLLFSHRVECSELGYTATPCPYQGIRRKNIGLLIKGDREAKASNFAPACTHLIPP
jgi:hypothetical protein